MFRAPLLACWLQLLLAVPAAGAAASSAGPWAVADVLLAPLVVGEADAAPLRDSPEVAYAACRVRWRRLGAVVCAAVVPQARGAAAQLSRAELEWRVLGVLGAGTWEEACVLGHVAWRRVRGAATAAHARLDAAVDASLLAFGEAATPGPSARDEETHGPWRRVLAGGRAVLAGGVATVLGAFDSGGRPPYAVAHGVHSGSSPVLDLVAAAPPGPAGLDD